MAWLAIQSNATQVCRCSICHRFAVFRCPCAALSPEPALLCVAAHCRGFDAPIALLFSTAISRRLPWFAQNWPEGKSISHWLDVVTARNMFWP